VQDAKLVELLRNHEQEAINILLQKYEPLIKYIIDPILPDYREREECLSDIAYRVWEKIDLFNENQGSFKSWLSVISRNMAYNRVKKVKKFSEDLELSDELKSNEKNPEEQLLLREKIWRMKQLFYTLDKNEKILIYRKYFYLQSTEQIAAELGLTERAVEGRLYRIKKKLRGKWDE